MEKIEGKMVSNSSVNTRQLLAESKFYEAYSRWDSDKQRYETWSESVDRVMDMHAKKYEDKLEEYPELKEYLDLARTAYKNKEVVGAQRALQFGGEQILKNNAKLYNCTSTYIDRPRAFAEIFWFSLCLAPETRIKTDVGIKELKDINFGDNVLSYNETSAQYEYKPVYNKIETPTKDYEKYEFQMEDGTIFHCTGNHRFLTKNRGWVEAKDLNEEDDLLNFNEI